MWIRLCLRTLVLFCNYSYFIVSLFCCFFFTLVLRKTYLQIVCLVVAFLLACLAFMYTGCVCALVYYLYMIFQVPIIFGFYCIEYCIVRQNLCIRVWVREWERYLLRKYYKVNRKILFPLIDKHPNFHSYAIFRSDLWRHYYVLSIVHTYTMLWIYLKYVDLELS